MTADPSPKTLCQSIGDASVQYLRYDGSGPSVLLLHAAGFLPWLWDPVARRLGERFTVVAPYFCDHRVFDLESGGLSWFRLAEDLVNLCGRLDIDAPFVVGHSMGATVGMIADAAFGLGAAGLVLIEPIFLPQSFYGEPAGPEDHPLAAKALKRRNHWEDALEAKRYLRSKPLFRNWDEAILEAYIQHGLRDGETGGLELSCPPPREAALFLGGSRHDPWPLLPQIHCPVLVLEGADSGNAELIDLKRAASLIPKASYRCLPGAGHLVPMEQPQTTARVVLEFIDRIGFR